MVISVETVAEEAFGKVKIAVQIKEWGSKFRTLVPLNNGEGPGEQQLPYS